MTSYVLVDQYHLPSGPHWVAVRTELQHCAKNSSNNNNNNVTDASTIQSSVWASNAFTNGTPQLFSVAVTRQGSSDSSRNCEPNPRSNSTTHADRCTVDVAVRYSLARTFAIKCHAASDGVWILMPVVAATPWASPTYCLRHLQPTKASFPSFAFAMVHGSARAGLRLG